MVPSMRPTMWSGDVRSAMQPRPSEVAPTAILAALDEPSSADVIGAALALLGSVVVIVIQCATARHFRIPAAFGLIFALGYTAVACLACNGVLVRLSGRVTWKGRTYQLAKTSAEGP